MESAKLLDCTLRDGAYLVNKEFGDDTIRGVVSGLVSAGTDIIEIGFLQDEGVGPGRPVFRNAQEAKRFIPAPHGGTLFAVLADFSRYSIQNLDDYDGSSFDAVRICFFKHERYDAISYFKAVKEKGYKLFIQPVDTLGYTDTELIELIELVNPIEPYCFSIVDTFGSMYDEDLRRIFSIIDHNLHPNSRIGFHSHNNMQMSGALSQSFLRMSSGVRNVVVDATISGMGRGAGNTPTELIAQYMVSKFRCHYDIDEILSLIDNYIEPIRARAVWGYNTDMFLCGVFSAHVNNITYLKSKSGINSKDTRFILDKIGANNRKRYHYDILERAYLELVDSEIDDSSTLAELSEKMRGRNVAIIAPGKSVRLELDKVRDYIEENNAVAISVNYIPDAIKPDYLYINNINRYKMLKSSKSCVNARMIATSNIKDISDKYVVSFRKLYKCGWQHSDNSTIFLLRLLDLLNVSRIGIAGLDGFAPNGGAAGNYAAENLEHLVEGESAILANREIAEMIEDFQATKQSNAMVEFITTSRFSRGL